MGQQHPKTNTDVENPIPQLMRSLVPGKPRYTKFVLVGLYYRFH